MSSRTIKIECNSGDGTTLHVSTDGQADDSALHFKIGDQTVWVDRFDLGDLIGWLDVEQGRYEAEFPYEPDEDDGPEGDDAPQ